MKSAGRPIPVREGIGREPEHIASVLLNTGAGDGRAGEAATLRQIRESFASHGWTTEITCIPAQRFTTEAPMRVRDARGVVVAAGGDGTFNVLANACRTHHRPVGLLALGNSNLAARALGLEPGVENAAANIAGGQPEDVRYAELNGRMFLSSALFGLYPALIAPRRHVKSGVGDRAAALASGLRMLVRSNAPFDAMLEATADAGTATIGDRVRSTTLQVALNIAPAGSTDPVVQACIERGELALTGLARYTRWPTVNALLAAALGTQEPAPGGGGIAACGSRIVVHTRRKQVPVSLDGDWRSMEPPLEFRVRVGGLQVVRLPRLDPASSEVT